MRRLDPDAPVYSNEAFPVLYLTGIPARWIPERYDPVKAVEREDFDEQMEKMREAINMIVIGSYIIIRKIILNSEFEAIRKREDMTE